jgi:hypothetical protein
VSGYRGAFAEGGALQLGAAWLTEQDRREIAAFKRYLAEVGNGPLREHPGWLPYALGRFFHAEPRTLLAPPEGYGDVPITAWSFPA